MTTRVVGVRQGVPFDVYIGRAFGGFPASRWGNPFAGPDKAWNIARYAEYVVNDAALLWALPDLRGRTLACWCKTRARPDEPCHGDVLAALLARHTDEELRALARRVAARRGRP